MMMGNNYFSKELRNNLFKIWKIKDEIIVKHNNNISNYQPIIYLMIWNPSSPTPLVL
jgi:hypothetical protein